LSFYLSHRNFCAKTLIELYEKDLIEWSEYTLNYIDTLRGELCCAFDENILQHYAEVLGSEGILNDYSVIVN
jgi:hypothetical protein